MEVLGILYIVPVIIAARIPNDTFTRQSSNARPQVPIGSLNANHLPSRAGSSHKYTITSVATAIKQDVQYHCTLPLGTIPIPVII